MQLTFVPHLIPIVRGIHSTLYAELQYDVPLEELQSAFEERYANEPFVDVLPLGSHAADAQREGLECVPH